MVKNYLKKDLYSILLFIVSMLAYGLFIPLIGFYWDDFPYMWFKHTNGTLGAIRALALDRPVLGLFYALPLSILGESPITWQIFAIFCRWFFMLSVFFFLNNLFPKNRIQNKFVTLLLAVFPGFSQQWISVVYSHAFLIFALYFLSLSLFIKSLNNEKFLWLGLISTFLAIICMAATEYVVGLEILRPLIIYKIISEKRESNKPVEKLRAAFVIWLPYLLAGFLFIVYRIFFASSVLYKVQQLDLLSQSPLTTIIQLFLILLKNIYTTVIVAWAQIINPLFNLDISSLFSKIYLGIFLSITSVSIIAIYLFFKNSVQDQGFYHQKEFSFQLWLGGIFSLFFAGLPFWAANLQPSTTFPSDRFFLPFMLGSSTMIFLLVYIIARSKVLFSVIFSIIFGLSFSFQVFQANEFRNEWDHFKNFMDQLTWRIPSLAENTLLVTDELPLKYYSDNSLTAAFNWIYADPHQENSLPYLINYTKARLGKSLPSLNTGTTVTHNYRTHFFSGSTDQMILFYHQPPGCVHIADPDLDPLNPLIGSEIRPATALSKPDLISAHNQQKPAFFLTQFPPETWCYYYQKASLAIANHEWQKAAELGDIAFSIDDYPNDASERMPFIEAYAMINDWEKAINLTQATYQISSLYQPMLCRLWERIETNLVTSSSQESILLRVNSILNCH